MKFPSKKQLGYLEVVKSFKIPSRSKKEIYHTVEVLENGKLVCDCFASMFKRLCHHKLEVLKIIQQ